MKFSFATLAVPLAAALLLSMTASSHATGLMTCKSGPKSGWKTMDALKADLTSKGWNVRRVKEDGGCYEVYATNEKGQRVESYFHPVTFQHMLTSTR